MRRQLSVVELMRGPLHDGSVHSVLHRQHLADGVTVHALQPLKEGPGQALHISTQLRTAGNIT